MAFVYIGSGLAAGFLIGLFVGMRNKKAILQEKRTMERTYNNLLDKMKTDGK